MKRFLVIMIAFCAVSAPAAVWRGPDGILYGNLCFTRAGVQQVLGQPVGSNCYAPAYRMWGFIGDR